MDTVFLVADSNCILFIYVLITMWLEKNAPFINAYDILRHADTFSDINWWVHWSVELL